MENKDAKETPGTLKNGILSKKNTFTMLEVENTTHKGLLAR